VKEIDREKCDCHSFQFIDYAHPREVTQDDRLSPTQKRSILCAWASDASAVDSRPGFRWLPGTPGPILVDHVLTALRSLDDFAPAPAERYCAIVENEAFYKPIARPGAAGLHAE